MTVSASGFYAMLFCCVILTSVSLFICTARSITVHASHVTAWLSSESQHY